MESRETSVHHHIFLFTSIIISGCSFEAKWLGYQDNNDSLFFRSTPRRGEGEQRGGQLSASWTGVFEPILISP